MRTTSISKAPTHADEFNHSNFLPFDDARMQANTQHLRKHPGLYEKSPGTSFPQRHGPTSTKSPPKPRRLNFSQPSADTPVPSVAAPHPTDYDTPLPRRSFPTTTTPSSKRSFPFNTRTRTPAERSPTFKRDVWDHFDSHGRTDFRQRLSSSHTTIGNHFNTRPIFKAKRPVPLVSNNSNTTNRYNRHPSSIPSTARSHLQRTGGDQFHFRINHSTVKTNLVCKVLAHHPGTTNIQQGEFIVPLTILLNNFIRTMQIIFVQCGPHPCYAQDRNQLLAAYFFHKRAMILPYSIIQQHQSVEFYLHRYFYTLDRLGKAVYINNDLRLPPQRSHSPWTKPFMGPHRPQYAFRATASTTVPTRPLTRSQTANLPLLPQDTDDTATVDEPMDLDEDPPQAVRDPTTIPSPPPLQRISSTPMEQVQEEQSLTSDEEMPPWESLNDTAQPSYRAQFHPPTPPRRSPQGNLDNLAYLHRDFWPVTSARSEAKEGMEIEVASTEEEPTKKQSSIPVGTTIPRLRYYTLTSIINHIEQSVTTFKETSKGLNIQHSYKTFDLLLAVLQHNSSDPYNYQTPTTAATTWSLIKLIGEIGGTLLLWASEEMTGKSHIGQTFPRDFLHQRNLFFTSCVDNEVDLPPQPEPIFPMPNDVTGGTYNPSMLQTPRLPTIKIPDPNTIDLIDLTITPRITPPSNEIKPAQNFGTNRPPSRLSKTITFDDDKENQKISQQELINLLDEESIQDENNRNSKRPKKKPKSWDDHPQSHHPHRRDDDDDSSDNGYPPPDKPSIQKDPTFKRFLGDTTNDDSPETPPKKVKKEPKSSSSLFQEANNDLTSRLLKAAKNIGMKPLEMVSDPAQRRSKFNTWSMLLQIVLSSHPETKPMFSSDRGNSIITKLGEPVDSYVFQLILAKCGPLAMNSLESTGTTSGYEAYVSLRRQCAQVNESLQQAAFQALLGTHWSDSETAAAFLIRFHTNVNKCQQLGTKFTEDDKVRFFFGATRRLTRQSPYHVRLELLNARRQYQPEPMTIADIETNLYAYDEEMSNLKQASSNRKVYKEENAFAAQRQSNHRTNRHKQSSEKKPYNSNAKCTFCQRTGHWVQDCFKKQQEQRITPSGHDSRRTNPGRGHPRSHPSTKPSGQQFNNRNKNGNQNSQYNKPPPTCYKCNQKGHYANECPNAKQGPPHGSNNRAMLADSDTSHFEADTKTPNDTRTSQQPSGNIRQTAHRASAVYFSQQPEMIMVANAVPLPRRHFYHQKWWKLHPSEEQHPPQDDFRNYIPDSGATSHFTPVEADLDDAIDCRVPIILADGNTVYATRIGYSKINFITDQGNPCTLHLVHVHYVPGLNHRLFSLQAFTRHTNYRAEIKESNTTLIFDDGDTYTWPFTPHIETYNRFQENANAAQDDLLEPNTQTTTSTGSEPTSDPDDYPDSNSTPNDEPFISSEQIRPTRTITLEKALLRFGFRSSRGLLAGTYYNIWEDFQVRPGYDSFSTSLRIAISRTRNLSRTPMNLPKNPFELLFIDVIPTPRMRALSVSTAFTASLLIVDAHSRFSMWIGLPKHDTIHIIEAIQHFITRTHSKGRTTTVQYIRTDAGSYFTSDEFARWCRHENIHLSIAAPHHQEMNSICERQWQTINQLARVLLVHARLPLEYFHFAVRYAIDIINVLPAKGVNDANGTPTCPHNLAFGVRPKIGNFRVFGCPAAIKRYTKTSSNGETASPSDIVDDFQPMATPLQRAVRGIFIGFPEHQAGWLFYLPNPLGNHHFIVSFDAVFDEAFESTLAHVHAPYSGAIPERSSIPLHEHLSTQELDDVPAQSTGNVAQYPYRLPISGEEGEAEVNNINPNEIFDDVDFLPIASVIQPKKRSHDDLINQLDDEIDNTDQQEILVDEDESTEEPPPRRSNRSNLGTRRNTFEQEYQTIYSAAQAPQYLAKTMMHPLQMMMFVATQQETKPQPIDIFLPEPTSFKAVLRLPDEIQKLWMKAIESEIKTLIDNGTFDLSELPRHGEQVIPIKLVYKAKQRSDGYLDKLKVRGVQRADLQWHKPEEDTWSPCASSWCVRMFFAEIVRRQRTAKLLDFIGAYLQGHAVGRHWVRFPMELAEYFPQFAKYFGVPMLLRKGMYGGTLSGKWWNQELTDWLISVGFVQSQLDGTYFVRINPDGSYIRLIFHVDDMIYFGNNDEIEQAFENEIKGRFNVNILGRANWFLQMRIHHHSDGSISIDQHRYVLNLLQRFTSKDAPYGSPRFRDTPAPPEYVYSITNRPVTQEDHQKINEKYPGLDFRSCLCTILYLAYSTRTDILFIVCKLAKACLAPGIKDFDALFWLLGYLRKYPAYGIRFYANANKSPINELLQAHKIETRDITAFSDASWQDCPDTGRSTIGYITIYQGGIIAANSSVAIPVAMSSAEAEYMAACAAAMNASVIRALLYDMRYLGTKDYKMIEDKPEFQPAILCVDNAAAVAMSESPKLTKKTRHIARHFHFVREGVKRGLHVVKWISNKAQLADVLTKTQGANKTDPQVKTFMYQLPDFLIRHTTKSEDHKKPS